MTIRPMIRSDQDPNPRSRNEQRYWNPDNVFTVFFLQNFKDGIYLRSLRLTDFLQIAYNNPFPFQCSVVGGGGGRVGSQNVLSWALKVF